MKKIISLFLALITIISIVFCTNFNVFAKTYIEDMIEKNENRNFFNINVDLEFHQSTARRLADCINEFRNSDNAWYYSEDGDGKTDKVYPDLSYRETLKYDYELEKVAMQRAAELAIKFEHDRPCRWTFNSSCYNMQGVEIYHSATWAENIAILGGTDESLPAYAQQMFEEENKDYNGQGHRRNMLGRWQTVGIGIAKVENGFVIAEEFSYDYTDRGSKYENNLVYTEPVDGMKTMTIEFGVYKDQELNGEFQLNNFVISTKDEYYLDYNSSGTTMGHDYFVASKNGDGTITPAPYISNPKSIDYFVEDELTDLKDFGLSFGYGACRFSWTYPEFMKISVADESIAKIYKEDGVTPTDTKNYGEKLKIELLKRGTTTITCQVFNGAFEECTREFTLNVKCNHDLYDSIILEERTCQNEGLLKTQCPSCGEIFENIDKSEIYHHWVLINTVPPTCAAAGYDEYRCSVCKKTGKNNIKKATGHTPVEVPRVEPTCHSVGQTAYTKCSVCNAVITRSEEIPMTPHVMESELLVPGSCRQKSRVKNYCVNCDYYSINYTDGKIDPDNHLRTSIIRESEEPTCTESGLTASIKCEDCNKLIQKQTVIEPLGHSYEITGSTKADCTKAGYTTYTCIRCGDTYSEVTENALGHNIDGTVIKEPTCAEEGYGIGHCLTCGEEINGSIPKLEHNADKKIVKATCTTDGYTTFTCNICNVTYTGDYVKATGHSADSIVKENYVAPTCKKAGGYDEVVYCKKCNEKISSTHKTLSKKVHNINKAEDITVKVQPATTKSNGYVNYFCKDCGEKISTVVIAKISKITLSATKFVYDGKAKKPTVTVTDSYGYKVSTDDYTVSYQKDCKNVGKCKVTVKFKEPFYSGSVDLYFTINPKPTTILKVSPSKKKITVKWKKQNKQVTGYQIQYSTSKNFKNAKTVTVTKNSTTSKTISKLKAKKKYYVRIRTYKTVGKDKFYSSWSKTKTIKCQ